MSAVVVQLLGVVAQLAPGVLAQLAGRQTDAEAIEAARAIVERMPAGTAATWSADLARREREDGGE